MRKWLWIIVVAMACSGGLQAADGGLKPAATGRRFTVRITPEMMRHSRLQDVLYFVDVVYGAAVLLILLPTRLSARLRDVAARRVRWFFIVAMLYFVLFSLAVTALEFPLSLYQGFIVPHQFDLTNQTFASWMGDFVKEIAVNLLIGAPIAALALLAIRRVRRWWIVLWLGSIPLIILGVVIAPLIIDPLFNQFVPLKDPVLRRDLLDEASRAGIEGSRVYQVNKSKQTKTMNAYVTGLGPSKRIVLWDTLLAKMDHDEILAVMGHEMGHYVLHHIWKGVAFGIAVSFFVFLIGQKIFEWGLTRWGGRWGIGDRGDAASLPWLLLVGAMIGFVLSPVTSGFSRHIEHQADKFGLELTHLNEAMASSFVKFAEDSKRDPNPPRFIEWWLYSHPSAQHRIDFALSYKPWQKAGVRAPHPSSLICSCQFQVMLHSQCGPPFA
ncbi:MAG TPA: M48 family metallopeptidase [Thermoanaerobaculia bacterium]